MLAITSTKIASKAAIEDNENISVSVIEEAISIEPKDLSFLYSSGFSTRYAASELVLVGDITFVVEGEF